jgi:hypothetical protein
MESIAVPFHSRLPPFVCVYWASENRKRHCRAGATLWGGVARALANQHGLILQGERGIRPDFERCQDLRVQMTDSLLPQQAVDLF